MKKEIKNDVGNYLVIAFISYFQDVNRKWVIFMKHQNVIFFATRAH